MPHSAVEDLPMPFLAGRGEEQKEKKGRVGPMVDDAPLVEAEPALSLAVATAWAIVVGYFSRRELA